MNELVKLLPARFQPAAKALVPVVGSVLLAVGQTIEAGNVGVLQVLTVVIGVLLGGGVYAVPNRA